MKRTFLFFAVATMLNAQDPGPMLDHFPGPKTPPGSNPYCYSPSGKIRVEQSLNHQDGKPDEYEIWLISTADQTKRHLLFTDPRDAKVVFSPEETWLAITNHVGSGYSVVLLYQQKAEFEYQQVADLTATAWEFFNQQNGLKKVPFGHAHADVVCWLGLKSANALMLCLSGEPSDPQGSSRGAWFCVYDIGTRTFTTNLEAINKNNMQLGSK